MIDYLGMVKEFHTKYNHHTQARPIWPPSEVIALRVKLIEEEADEFVDGAIEGTMADVADAIADILYVAFGAALAFGIPIEEVFTEVHRSNMTKSMLKDEKSIKGKTIKGPDYSPADVESIIDRHRMLKSSEAAD